MQSNKNIKGRAIISDEENIREKSLKLYTYLVCHSSLRNKPDQFGDNVRIFQQRDIVLSRIKKILKLDERTIKKYWAELESQKLIVYYPNSWRQQYIKDKVFDLPFNEQWKLRNKHKECYYEIPIKQGQLFRKIPKETLIRLNEDYQVDELVLKVYITLINYQEDCIVKGYNSKKFTYQDLRDILGYKEAWSSNRVLEGALTTLSGFGLIDLETGEFVNSYGFKIPVFILKQANFYFDFKIMDFEPAPENVIEEEQIKDIKNENKEFYPEIIDN